MMTCLKSIDMSIIIKHIKQRLLSNSLPVVKSITSKTMNLAVVLDQLNKPGFGIINIIAWHCWIRNLVSDITEDI